MAIKTILTEPNKILRQVSKQVEKVGEEEKKIMDDMLETMYQANGIGLAAIQIGIPNRSGKRRRKKKSYVFCKSSYKK